MFIAGGTEGQGVPIFVFLAWVFDSAYFPKEIGKNVKSYCEKASHLIAAQKYVAFGWSADPVASAFIGL